MAIFFHEADHMLKIPLSHSILPFAYPVLSFVVINRISCIN